MSEPYGRRTGPLSSGDVPVPEPLRDLPGFTAMRAEDAARELLDVRFSEVHWYKVRCTRGELEDALGVPLEAAETAGLTRGPLESYPVQLHVVFPGVQDTEDRELAVIELLTGLAIDQPGALIETDGQEITSITPVTEGKGDD